MMRGSTDKEKFIQALQEGLEEYLVKVYGPGVTWHPDQKRELSLAFYAGIHWCNQANGLVTIEPMTDALRELTQELLGT